MPEIEIVIDGGGTPIVDAMGFVGPSCKDATTPYEKAFDNTGENSESEIKPEYNQVDSGGTEEHNTVPV